jgi:hypothetical protein
LRPWTPIPGGTGEIQISQLSTDTRRLLIEIVATLVHIKKPMADLLLRPAGVPNDLIASHLYRRDAATGRILSKREVAPLLFDALEQRGELDSVARELIGIAARWSNYHLADDEYTARATVQKAREVLDVIETMQAREQRQRELARQEELAKLEKQRAEIFKRESDLLLMMFDDLARSNDHQQRGFLLQDLLNRVFHLCEIPVHRAFTRNSGGEHIDAAFKLEGWHYLVECRWRAKLTDIREVDGLQGQVRRSGKQTMGIFWSINGWSDNVPGLLKQNPEKDILLLEGHALRCTLARQVDLREYLLGAIANLNLMSEPYLNVNEFQQGAN